MKKYIGYLVACILIVFIGIFSFNIFLRTYFNEEYYTIPNLQGLTVSQAQGIQNINKLHFVVAGEDYSELPKGEIFRQSPTPDKIVKADRTLKVWISKGQNDFTVPDLRNKNLIDATAFLQAHGVKINKTTYVASNLPYNTVLATSPAAGENIEKTSGVSLLLSNTNSAGTIEVPDTIGFTVEEATNELVSKGLIIGNVTEKSVPDLEPGIVVETTNIGKTVPAGTTIDMVVSI